MRFQFIYPQRNQIIKHLHLNLIPGGFNIINRIKSRLRPHDFFNNDFSIIAIKFTIEIKKFNRKTYVANKENQ